MEMENKKALENPSEKFLNIIIGFKPMKKLIIVWEQWKSIIMFDIDSNEQKDLAVKLTAYLSTKQNMSQVANSIYGLHLLFRTVKWSIMWKKDGGWKTLNAKKKWIFTEK